MIEFEISRKFSGLVSSVRSDRHGPSGRTLVRPVPYYRFELEQFDRPESGGLIVGDLTGLVKAVKLDVVFQSEVRSSVRYFEFQSYMAWEPWVGCECCIIHYLTSVSKSMELVLGDDGLIFRCAGCLENGGGQ